MQDVAEAAGVHRATVHRHFPSRDDLLEALRRQSLDQLQDLLADEALAGEDAGAALEHLTAGALCLGDRTRTWRILPAYDDASDARASRLRGPLLVLMQRAQGAGAVRPDVPAELLISAWGGLVMATLPLIARGELTVESGASHVRRMLGAP